MKISTCIRWLAVLLGCSSRCSFARPALVRPQHLSLFVVYYITAEQELLSPSSGDVVDRDPTSRANPENDESVARLERITQNMHTDGIKEAKDMENEAFGVSEDPYAAFGVDPEEASYDPHRMPLGGMTNLHHPTSCSRKTNVHKRWLEARVIIEDFLDQPYGEAARLGMIGGRWWEFLGNLYWVRVSPSAAAPHCRQCVVPKHRHKIIRERPPPSRL